MVSRYRANKNKISDGKVVLAEIFNVWLTNVIQNEVPEEYQGPKTIEVPVERPSTKKTAAASYEDEYDFGIPRHPDDEDWDLYLHLNDDEEPEEEIEFDDDGSNWAYNERKDI